MTSQLADAPIVQRHGLVRPLKFCFAEDHLAYRGLTLAFKVRYEHIPSALHYTPTETKPAIVRAIPLYLVAVALVLLLRDHHPRYGSVGFEWFLKSMGAFVAVLVVTGIVLRRLFGGKGTLMETSSGKILVWKGRQHDEILQAIGTRRLAALRRLSAPDPANSPEEERRKLKWLFDEGAIDEEEFNRLRSQTAQSPFA